MGADYLTPAQDTSVPRAKPRKLLVRLADVLRAKHYSYRTEQAYVYWRIRTGRIQYIFVLFAFFVVMFSATHVSAQRPTRTASNDYHEEHEGIRERNA